MKILKLVSAPVARTNKCFQVLESEPKNLKALYRRTQAYLKLGRTVTAAKDLDRALDISPNGRPPSSSSITPCMSFPDLPP